MSWRMIGVLCFTMAILLMIRVFCIITAVPVPLPAPKEPTVTLLKTEYNHQIETYEDRIAEQNIKLNKLDNFLREHKGAQKYFK